MKNKSKILIIFNVLNSTNNVYLQYYSNSLSKEKLVIFTVFSGMSKNNVDFTFLILFFFICQKEIEIIFYK